MGKDLVDIKGLSFRSLYIELFFDQQPLGPATGFFIKKDGSYYLISNWHVFSGMNPIKKQPIRSDGGIPKRYVRFTRNTEIPRFP